MAGRNRDGRAACRGKNMGVLDGKIAIITGGTSGIGERIAEVFVAEGANVIVAARRQEEGAALEKRLGIAFARTDVSIEAEVRATIDQTVQRFGRIDCLVNNAGIASTPISITDIDSGHFDQIMAVNVRGVFLGIKHVAPVMIAQGSGSIINISSGAGLLGGGPHAYAASKAAVHSLTRTAAAELGEKGIRVNSISPGPVMTGIFAKAAGVAGPAAERAVEDAVAEIFATISPIPRAATTEDIARGCVYLASDGSSFVNGHDLVIDGGATSIWTRWSDQVVMRAEIGKRIQEAVAKL